MTAPLIAMVAAFVAGMLLLYITAVIDSDQIRTVPVYVPRPAGSTHPCWAEYSREVLRANRARVAAEMAAVRAELIGRPPAGVSVVHIGQREVVMV